MTRSAHHRSIKFDMNLMRTLMLDLANDIRSLSDFKRNTVELLDRLRETGDPLVLTVNDTSTNSARLSRQPSLLEERAPPDHDTDVARLWRRRPVDEVHVLPVWRHVVLRAPVSRSDERHVQRVGDTECQLSGRLA